MISNFGNRVGSKPRFLVNRLDVAAEGQFDSRCSASTVEESMLEDQDFGSWIVVS